MRQWKSTLKLRTCQGCVYTGSFELDYPRTLLAAPHVHRIEIPYQAFPEWFGPRILSLKGVDYFGTTDHLMGKTSSFTGKSGSRIEESGIEDWLKRTSK